LAVQNGHSSIVKSLIEFGADVNVKNDEEVSPLDISCRKGYFEISKNIIANQQTKEQDEIIDRDNDYPLHVACFEGAHEVVKLLLLQGIYSTNDEMLDY
jgi:ankyrin repeat protein